MSTYGKHPDGPCKCPAACPVHATKSVSEAVRKAFDVQGARTGRFSSTTPNVTEVDKPKAIEMNPKTGVEMEVGKKYLLVVDVTGIPLDQLDKFTQAAPLYEAAFKGRGIDVTFLATPWPTKIYELLPAEEKCLTPLSSNVSQ